MCNWGYIDVQLGIHRCTTGDTSPTISLYTYICLNLIFEFNIHVLQKNGFCRFISDLEKDITSFVA